MARTSAPPSARTRIGGSARKVLRSLFEVQAAAFDASVPLSLSAADGSVFFCRSTWSLAKEAGACEVPFLLSRSQMASIGAVTNTRSDRVTVRGPTGEEAEMRASVEEGRLVLPLQFGSSDRSETTGSPAAAALISTKGASNAQKRARFRREPS